MSSIDHSNLSLLEVADGLHAIAGEAQSAFGDLGARQLNWRPDANRWSVAQCLDHLLTLNRLMLDAAGEALNGERPHPYWRRVPLLTGVLGRALIRAVAPGAPRKIKTPVRARPAVDVGPDVVPRFVAQHRDIATWLRTVDESHAAGAIMTSPFSRFVAYSVLNGCRLMLAHDRRHLAQAHRITRSPGFPVEPPGA